ncbi:4-alpha-glucanotransferase [Oscillibacter valericigenes]|uniref:4-alpha-glucanotransferase n=1 Tax=Oscillibacter valericigenes TaxID=351091 RepID=UPI001F287B97|nr:4-alpha-glucanotransferase [Oscillibacter valericigenes]MCF2665295.1 4-alpha-glucanotransferase [Oscillibacter valericigenes]
MKRSCGILLPVSALPSPYGIGTLGKEAYEFVDFLHEARQSWWQMLPVGPTSYGDSPYQSFSAYAGNPYFVDLETLRADGLLTKAELESVDWGTDPETVDYGKIYKNRFWLLEKATERGWKRDAGQVKAFTEENAGWLPDYALFMALKRRFGMKSWTEWENEDIRLRRPEAVERYRRELAEDIRLFTYIQYLFFQQWNALRDYAHEKGIGIIGDLPIYVAMDSADVWADPESFQLDERNVPVEVSGVPPDYFSEDGQLWGNPLYDWDAMKQDGYAWWVRRIEGASHLYDVLRIDHFRGLESYWAVPYGETTAKIGRWVKGPGMDLMNVLTARFPNLSFIAEDLGYLTPEVHQLLKDSGLPGMKILEFAFDSREPSNYLPHTYSPNCVCYAGTHDNAPIMAWREEAAPADIALAVQYLGLNEEEGFNWGMIRGGMSSVADLFVVQMQDYLGLGAKSRMNTPGILGGNWQWRMKQGQIDQTLTEKIAETARIYGRSERAWQA